MVITILGASGNMGECVTKLLLEEEYIDKVKILGHHKKSSEKLLKSCQKYIDKIEIVYGSLSDIQMVSKVIDGADYVINMAAVIPPLSDKNPHAAIEVNEKGAAVLAEAISSIKTNQPKLIHISTMGIYGDRNCKHPFGEVGDPLLISPFDIYAMTKMRGEFTILESEIEEWVVLRQTAVLYKDLMMKNISDGLMFHTCFNSPLEWCTAEDSAVLIRNIIRRDKANELNEENFWKHCFNIGGGEKNRVTGFETLDLGFKIIGASTYDFFDTNYNSSRNFHGVWFSDGYKLEELFHYQKIGIEDFWQDVLNNHKYFKLARILPKKMLKSLVIKRLLKDSNAPYFWYNHNDEARLIAYFGGKDKFDSIPTEWKNFKLTCRGEKNDGSTLDYDNLRKKVTRLNHYFDIDKSPKEVTITDLQNVAKAHGGKLITESFTTGDVYTKVEWETQDGERFFAKPFTILYCGHWMNISYKEYIWDFDRLAKKDEIYKEIWYDSHESDENICYYFDKNFEAKFKKF